MDMTPPAVPTCRTIVLVGLMGVGKSSVGRAWPSRWECRFKDADLEIEAAAGRSIPDIFKQYGEADFPRRASGGSSPAFWRNRRTSWPPAAAPSPNPTRASMIKAKAISVWLKADIEVLARRVARRDNPPLLIGKDPHGCVRAHVGDRYPAFETADIVVETGDWPHQVTVDAILEALAPCGGPAIRPVVSSRDGAVTRRPGGATL